MDWVTVDCGAPKCTSAACGDNGHSQIQPRERYQPYDVNGVVCLAYQPVVPRILGCLCSVFPEE
jgi:hypothetical protein